MRVVAALGGNALLKRGEPLEPEVQRRNVAAAVEAACRFVESGGRMAGMGRLEDAEHVVEGLRGTIVRPAGVSLDFVRAAASVERR